MLQAAKTIDRIHSEIIDLHGYFALAVYIHYYVAGSLKYRTNRYTVKLGQLRQVIDSPHDPLLFATTRRWLPKGEAPFPGYCRAPGSGKCLPALCNCKKLIERWNTQVIKNKAKKEKKPK
ncbi:uncharacterized protein LOC113503839 [Trichoplusia ni]|uniref:Uncharacterized protein LOC113503839 n=1 Tax=Trichoplusia ni TaxID=7111 RepID=A0A7E5WN32_TRINI|nr:uncharacterized protein LOC113503839 [Trichoplusia ni]